MARGRITELFGRKDNKVTQRLIGGSRKTEIMRNTNNTNVTWVMDESQGESYPVQIGMGSQIGEYQVKDVVSENTGEATLLLVEKESIEYILKLYHKNKTPKEKLLEILNGITSNYVIRSVNQGMYNDRFYEVLPYFSGGDLLAQMPISETDIEKVIIPCVNEGLKALHDKDIIHRDIKPGNIFLTEDKKMAVIGDFGISSVLNQEVSVRATSMSRTLGYSAPETSNGFISKESDYYSFGITIYHLVLGVDPFAGMSDMQILYQTINKKLEIPQTVSYRLQCLIKGLTIKDRNDRWGYDEVQRWINGEAVDIKERIKRNDIERPYNFLKDEYYDLTSLSMAFAQNWDNAKKHLFRGLVDKYLASFNEEMASQCMDFKEMADKDLAVFNLIYLLNPNAPLCYKGTLYNDMESVGAVMASAAPDILPDIAEMICNGALHQYVSENDYDERLVQAVYGVTSAMRYNPKSNKYFKLMYTLNPSMGFEVNRVRCEDLKDLIDYLESVDSNTRDNIADHLIDNEMFIAWLDSLGYDKQIDKWKDLYKKVEW